MRLALPWALLACLPVAAVLLQAWRRRPPALVVPDLREVPHDPQALRWHRLVLLLEAAGCLLLVLAMARPQWSRTTVRDEREAVDLLLVLDVSGSMAAIDLPEGTEPAQAAHLPTRLDCARRELERFMQTRPEDRFGLVGFARRPYPACPLTFDHEVLRSRLQDLDTDLLDDGTGLTAAIALGTLHTRTSPSPHRVMVLLTDGRDNVPAELTPEAAARLAAEQGVTVHVVGIGSARAVLPVETVGGTQFRPVESARDAVRLEAIAKAGGGVFVRAPEPQRFAAAIAAIAATEKGRIRQPPREVRHELFPGCALAGLVALAGSLWLARSFR